MGLAQIPDLLVLGIVFLVGWGAQCCGCKDAYPAHKRYCWRWVCLRVLHFLTCPGRNQRLPEYDYAPCARHGGFLLGKALSAGISRRRCGKSCISPLGHHSFPALLVFACTWLLSSDLVLALLLGGVATATDPAAIMDVVRENRAKGPIDPHADGGRRH